MSDRRSMMRMVRLFVPCVTFFLTASCAGQEKIDSVVASEIFGTWEGSSGGRMRLHEDRTFDLHDVSWDERLDGACPATAKGSWGLWESDGGDTYSISEEAQAGNSLGLNFAGVGEEGCYMTLNVLEGGNKLCASDDPDLVCGIDTRFSRTDGKRSAG